MLAIAIPTLTPDDDRPALELDRSPQLGGQALGGRNGVFDAVDPIEQDRELVPALARRDIAGTDRARDSLGDFDQQPVAGAMTQRVVDDLEVVEVEEQESNLQPASPPARECPLDVVAEQDSIREPGQRIVERIVKKPRLHPFLIGRVDEQALGDAAAVRPTLRHRIRLVVDPDHRAVPSDDPVVGPQRTLGGPVLRVPRDGLLAIVGMDQPRPQLLVGEERLGRVADDRLDLRAHVREPTAVGDRRVGDVDVDGGGHAFDEDPVSRSPPRRAG